MWNLSVLNYFHCFFFRGFRKYRCLRIHTRTIRLYRFRLVWGNYYWSSVLSFRPICQSWIVFSLNWSLKKLRFAVFNFNFIFVVLCNFIAHVCLHLHLSRAFKFLFYFYKSSIIFFIIFWIIIPSFVSIITLNIWISLVMSIRDFWKLIFSSSTCSICIFLIITLLETFSINIRMTLKWIHIRQFSSTTGIISATGFKILTLHHYAILGGLHVIWIWKIVVSFWCHHWSILVPLTVSWCVLWKSTSYVQEWVMISPRVSFHLNCLNLISHVLFFWSHSLFFILGCHCCPSKFFKAIWFHSNLIYDTFKTKLGIGTFSS